MKNKAFHEKEVIWWTGQEIVGGFYAANPTDSIVASEYPWEWQKLEYDDRAWKMAEGIMFMSPTTEKSNGHGWILQPRTTAVQKTKKKAFHQIIRSTITELPKGFKFGQEPSIYLPIHQQLCLSIRSMLPWDILNLKFLKATMPQ